jgi:outer membrane lipoprotein-sorting protein
MTRLIALPLLIVALMAGPARAQTAEEVVEKYLAAIGGRDALGKLTTRRSTGTVTLSTPAGELSGPIEITLKVPHKSRAFMTLDLTALGAGEMIIDQKFDGTTGVTVNSLQGETPITGNQLDNLRNSTFPTPLLAYKEAGSVIALEAADRVGSEEAFVLVVTPKAGSPARLFVSKTTGLILRTVTTINSPEAGNLEQTSTLSDYRKVDGVMVPFRTVASNPLQSITIALTKVEHNVAVDDAVFVKK